MSSLSRLVTILGMCGILLINSMPAARSSPKEAVLVNLSPTKLISSKKFHPINQPLALPVQEDVYIDQLAEDTWAYLHSDWATDNHLPWSWRSLSLTGGDFVNPAEIGFYALSWITAHDMQRPWSPNWATTETEVTAILNQLRIWQTDPVYGKNAYNNSVFYQWYWINSSPPGVGDNSGDNHLVPSIDNAWLAASLITIREYAEANNHPALAQNAGAILNDMDFTLWYHYDTHRFSWGAVEDPLGGAQADYYSNENRIINFVSRALGHLSADEFQMSLAALEKPSGTYDGITVNRVAWDGSYFTYAGPALFIREMDTLYGWNTLIPATQSQIKYAENQNYAVWGLSDSYDTGAGGYIQQGAPPVAMTDPPEEMPGLVTPHASALALITPVAPQAIANLESISSIFNCDDPSYGFRDSIMTKAGVNYGNCSDRFSALAQEWIFLSIANHENNIIWSYFYRDDSVVAAHAEMYDPTWALVWSDEFNGIGGIDPSNWICDMGTSYPGGPPNWGTGEIESYSCSTNNIFQSSGHLNIRALHTGIDPLTNWTSSRIETVRTDFQPPPNGMMAIEARIQLPNVTTTNGLGYWPAFWMLGAPYRGDYNNWPGIGEIDVMENINGLNQWWGTLHCGTNPGGPCNETTGIGGSVSGFSPTLQDTFHTYRMELDRSTSPEQIRWYVDGIKEFTVYSNQVDATTWDNAINHGFFIILNVAIGGGWPGNPTASTISGGTMLVDYVHVYYLGIPIVHSVLRTSSNPTSATSVDFTVTFSESVTGVNAGDFTLTTTGVSGAAVSGVSGTGSVYTVTVNTGSGNGTIRLDVLDDDTIVDAALNPLGAGFTSGETYTVTKIIPPPTTLVNSVLPTSRSIPVGTLATIFNTVINAGANTAAGLTLSMNPVPAGTFAYQQTDCATNAVVGTPNPSLDLAPGGVLCYVLSFTPSATFAATSVHIQAQAINAPSTTLLTGINTWLLRATVTPEVDIIALTTTTDFHQVSCSGANVFAVALSNVGAAATGDITVTANTGTAILPLSISISEIDSVTAAVIGDNVLQNVGAGENRSVAVFVTFNGCIAFDPAANRIFIEFRDASNNVIGSTSTAVSTGR